MAGGKLWMRLLAALLCACAAPAMIAGAGMAEAVGTGNNATEDDAQVMKMWIDGTPVGVEWEDNASVEALEALCPLTIDMSMYGGFEQVGSIGATLPRDDGQTVTAPGDIVLYSGNQIVVFYGSNSWAYTRLGRIADLSAQDLAGLLGKGDVTVTIEKQGR